MKESVDKKVKALIEKAKQGGTSEKIIKTSRTSSSLHEIIRTKEQAQRFMKALQTA